MSRQSEPVAIDVSRKFLAEIKNGDADHGLSIAQMLLSEGPDLSPDLLIVLVESVIELSVLAGSTDAKTYLSDKWPTLKQAHLRRITERRNRRGPQ